MSSAVSVSVLLVCVVLAACARTEPEARQQAARAAVVAERFRAGIERFDSALVRFERTIANAEQSEQRAAFEAARRAYKRIEFLAEHYTPATAKGINGPALNDVEEDDPNQMVIPPEGLQAIEALLYADPPATPAALQREAAVLRSNVRRLRAYAAALAVDDEHIFLAMHEEMARMISLGLSGFDTPLAGTAIPEAAEALAELRAVFTLYRPELVARDAALARRTDSLFVLADSMLRAAQGPGADTAFNRLAFIRSVADPLFGCLARSRMALGIVVRNTRRALRADALSLFARDAVDAYFFAPAWAQHPTRQQAELGRLLFFDPVLSGNGARSCASCHRPERAFTDGRPRSLAFDFKGTVERNAPTLLNAALQPGQFYDRRVMFLEDQATAVIANPAEMHGSLAEAEARIAQSPEYTALFVAAFGSKPAGSGARAAAGTVSETFIRSAIAAYVRTLVALDSPFDRYMRGDDSAIDEEAARGFNLFMGRARCGACHFAPLFNGVAPPLFAEAETEIIGATIRHDTRHPVLDPDVGRFAVHGVELDRFAFKTPTLRNVALTAPYMHNGAFASLEDVLDFYNRGGALGLGIELPTQTLSPDPLGLTVAEQRAIIAFLRSLTDTSGTAARPAALPSIAGSRERAVGGRY